MANQLLAVVYEKMAIVSDEYFDNVRQGIQSLAQSLLALESAILLFQPGKLKFHNVRPSTWPYQCIFPTYKFLQPYSIVPYYSKQSTGQVNIDSFKTDHLKTIFKNRFCPMLEIKRSS